MPTATVRFERGFTRVALLVTLGFAAPASLAAQQHQFRWVIATNVACRAEPRTSAPVVRRFDLGDVVVPRRESATRNGVWYLETSWTRDPGCWIYGPLTTDGADRERALVNAADRILSRPERVAFEDYVAIDNFLRVTRLAAHSDTTVLERSPLLQLRWLQILERATRAVGSRRSVTRNPLVYAWFVAHRAELRYHEPSGGWMLPADVYWSLYAEHRNTPWAEEIAWAAARGDLGGDECDAACRLDMLSRTYARYWKEFPQGRWVTEALTQGVRQTDYGLQAGCDYGGTAEAARVLATSIRESLAFVTNPRKDQLLAKVREIERICEAEGA